MSKDCTCQDWIENIGIVNAPYQLHFLAVGEYQGKKFDFCPWCGKRLLGPTSLPTDRAHQISQCTCGTQAYYKCTTGCPVHGFVEFRGDQ